MGVKYIVNRWKSLFHSQMLLSHVAKSKQFWLNFADSAYDTQEVRSAVGAMNKVYQAETNIKHAKKTIIDAHRNIKAAESRLPLMLRLGVPFYFRISGKSSDREHDAYGLDEYVRLRENWRTKQKGYYSVPDSYSHIVRKAIGYEEAIYALTEELAKLIEARRLIQSQELFDTAVDFSLITGDEKHKPFLKRFVSLTNKVNSAKSRLLASTQDHIDDIQLRVGAYYRFLDTQRKVALPHTG